MTLEHVATIYHEETDEGYETGTVVPRLLSEGKHRHIDNDERVEKATRWYREVYAPSTLKRSQFQARGMDSDVLCDFFSDFDNRPMLLYATAAFSLTVQDVCRNRYATLSNLARRCMGKALRLLHQELQHPVNVADMSLTVLRLAGIMNLTRCYLIANMHMQQLTNVLNIYRQSTSCRQCKFRTSDTNLPDCIHLITNDFIAAYESAGQYYYSQEEATPAQTYRGTRETRMYQPRPPLSPELCQKIAPLPEGMLEICLSGRINMGLLNNLVSIHHMQSWTVSSFDIECHAINILELFEQPALPPFQLALGIGLVAYCIHLNRHERQLIYVVNEWLQIACLKLLAIGMPARKAENEVFTWIASVLLAAAGPSNFSWSLAFRLMRLAPPIPPKYTRLDICRKFFWDRSLTKALASLQGLKEHEHGLNLNWD